MELNRNLFIYIVDLIKIMKVGMFYLSNVKIDLD